MLETCITGARAARVCSRVNTSKCKCSRRPVDHRLLRCRVPGVADPAFKPRGDSRELDRPSREPLPVNVSGSRTPLAKPPPSFRPQTTARRWRRPLDLETWTLVGGGVPVAAVKFHCSTCIMSSTCAHVTNAVKPRRCITHPRI